MVGGVVVSTFALLGDLLKPKSFAGLFGAAPSVALATMVLTVMKQGKGYVSVEARSILLGSLAFFLYASVVSRLLMRRKLPVLPVINYHKLSGKQYRVIDVRGPKQAKKTD